MCSFSKTWIYWSSAVYIVVSIASDLQSVLCVSLTGYKELKGVQYLAKDGVKETVARGGKSK